MSDVLVEINIGINGLVFAEQFEGEGSLFDYDLFTAHYAITGNDNSLVFLGGEGFEGGGIFYFDIEFLKVDYREFNLKKNVKDWFFNDHIGRDILYFLLSLNLEFLSTF